MAHVVIRSGGTHDLRTYHDASRPDGDSPEWDWIADDLDRPAAPISRPRPLGLPRLADDAGWLAVCFLCCVGLGVGLVVEAGLAVCWAIERVLEALR